MNFINGIMLGLALGAVGILTVLFIESIIWIKDALIGFLKWIRRNFELIALFLILILSILFALAIFPFLSGLTVAILCLNYIFNNFEIYLNFKNFIATKLRIDP